MPEEFVEDILDEVATTDDTPVEESSVEGIDDKSLEQLDEEVPAKETPTEDTPKTDVSIEDLATQIGWNPNYAGEDKVDAATFILKSREIQETMRDHNKELREQLSNMQGSIEALKSHNERVYQADVKRMQAEIDDLKRQRKEAIELADVAKVDELDKQISDKQRDLSKPAIEEPTPRNEIYEDWIKDNQWYLTDPEMATYAEVVAQQYEGVPLNRIYNLIRRKVEEVFPEKFEKETKNENATNLENLKTPTNKKKPIGPSSPVESPTNPGNKKNFTEADLTPEQKTIMNQFVKTGVMTKEQYVADIAKMQEE